MAQLTRQYSKKDELWNVKLLPTVETTTNGEPPHGPGPAGGRALVTPALLSVREMTLTALPKAA